ncbi:MAG: hypothetical protein KDJ47_13910 [Hyphomicrobiaceae bacterium]|nr:hypothetical protein [Hyphomicrobiaceae bacterium]
MRVIRTRLYSAWLQRNPRLSTICLRAMLALLASLALLADAGKQSVAQAPVRPKLELEHFTDQKRRLFYAARSRCLENGSSQPREIIEACSYLIENAKIGATIGVKPLTTRELALCYIGRARGKVRLKSFTAAGIVPDLDSAVKLLPDEALAYQARGEFLVSLSNPLFAGRSRADLEKVIAINPDDVGSMRLLALAQAKVLDLEAARSTIDRAVEVQRRSQPKPILSSDQRKLNEIAKALKLKPIDPETQQKEWANRLAPLLLARATILLTLGDTRGATAEFEAAAKISSVSAKAHAGLGLIAAAEGEFERAQALLSKAIEGMPSNAQFRLWRARAAMGALNDNAALADLYDAIARFEMRTDKDGLRQAHAWRALLMQSAGRSGEAAADCRVSIELNEGRPFLPCDQSLSVKEETAADIHQSFTALLRSLILVLDPIQF